MKGLQYSRILAVTQSILYVNTYRKHFLRVHVYPVLVFVVIVTARVHALHGNSRTISMVLAIFVRLIIILSIILNGLLGICHHILVCSNCGCWLDMQHQSVCNCPTSVSSYRPSPFLTYQLDSSGTAHPVHGVCTASHELGPWIAGVWISICFFELVLFSLAFSVTMRQFKELSRFGLWEGRSLVGVMHRDSIWHILAWVPLCDLKFHRC